MSESDGDLVWLSVGPAYEDGELISRMRLPNDALRSALEIDGAYLEGAEARMYEVWTVER
ncbi:hypothetical protein GW571_14795 (plasmid) [Clavibacter capsici]|uniref:Uncharacterized protein n=1 Tax=Clavibacter capsici TaxID=1874630 RepID=A0AAE6XSG2_9MICO|nr:hypothetical protein [Clavibacter capsici]QIS40562.1 hypothetical protein GW572_15425 [Clavibacter capsici]QIS43506.1 hypothetical protein GW571_14795 [Clavibacter capsici]QIS46447.1 hypothetical protein GW570_14755 [Clavibacter capsici]